MNTKPESLNDTIAVLNAEWNEIGRHQSQMCELVNIRLRAMLSLADQKANDLVPALAVPIGAHGDTAATRDLHEATQRYIDALDDARKALMDARSIVNKTRTRLLDAHAIAEHRAGVAARTGVRI